MSCISEALKYLNTFDESFLKEYIDQVFDTSKNSGISLEAASDIVNSQLKTTFENDLYRINYTQEVVDPLLEDVKKGKFKLSDVLSKNTRVLGGKNVESTIATHLIGNFRQTIGKLLEPEQDTLIKGDADLLVADIYDGRITVSNLPQADQVALHNISSTLRNWIEKISRVNLIKSTAMGVDHFNKYRLLKATYNPLRVVKLTKEYFINQMLKRADIEKMFPASFNVQADAREAFSKQFDNIYRGDKISITVRDIPQLQKRSQMFVIWKDLRSYLEHEREFGYNSNLFEAWMSDLNSVSRSTGVSQVLGADPDWAFRQLEKASPKSINFTNPEDIYLDLKGLTGAPYSPRLAQFGANLRAWTSTAILGPIMPLITRMDWGLGMQFLKGITDSNAGTFFYRIATSLHRIIDPNLFERDSDWKRILQSYSDGINSHTGAFLRSMESGFTAWATKGISAAFYKYSFMKALDVGSRAASVRAVSEFLAANKGKTFEELNPFLKTRLNQFNIQSQDWDLLRSKFDNLATLDAIDKMSDTEINDYADRIGINKSTARDSLSAKLQSYLQAAADENILHPGAAERAFFHRGTQAGTLYGELARNIGQFKGYLAAYANRILINGITNDAPNSKYYFLAANLAYVTPLAVLSNGISNALYGQPMKLSPADWSPSDYLNNLAPAFFVFSRLLDPSKQYDDRTQLLNSIFGTPSTKTLLDIGSLGLKTLSLPAGDFDKNIGDEKKRVAQVAKDVIPGASLV